MDSKYLDLINKKKQLEIKNIKDCNKYSLKYGLTLNDNQIKNILERRIDALKNSNRVEFREDIIEKIIKEFCDSPYIFQDNYTSTLYQLVEIFYEYKNETMDLISDDDLIKFMKESFDGECSGDLDYLEGTAMERMKSNVLKRLSLDYKKKEDEDYE